MSRFVEGKQSRKRAEEETRAAGKPKATADRFEVLPHPLVNYDSANN